jgi:hypothetical protein
MPTAKIQRATAKGKSWKAEIFENGKKIKTIQGGQKGTKLGGSRTSAFKARHGNKTAKQYINDKQWEKGNLLIGKTLRIPKGKKI